MLNDKDAEKSSDKEEQCKDQSECIQTEEVEKEQPCEKFSLTRLAYTALEGIEQPVVDTSDAEQQTDEVQNVETTEEQLLDESMQTEPPQ